MVRTALLSLALTFFASPAYAAASVEVTQRSLSAGTVIRGAQRVEMLELSFDAGCDEDVRLQSVRIRHRGLGDGADVARIYALHNGRRITRSQSFNARNQISTLRFRGFTIPACEKTVLTIAADFAADAATGGEHILSIERAEDIDAGDAEATLEISASGLAVRTAPVSKGVITVSYPDLPGNAIRYGKNRLVGRITLEADRESDHLIHAMTITNDGKARDKDLANLRFVSSDGKAQSTASSLDGDAVRFIFKDPLVLRKNQSRTFQIRSDVTASRRKTVRLLIEEPADIEASAQTGRARK